MLTEQYDALAVDILRNPVRIDTSNPPGNELAAVAYLQERLAQALCGLGDGHIRCAITETMRTALETIAGGSGERAHTTRLLQQQRIEAALAAAGFVAWSARAVRPLFYDTAAVAVLSSGDTQTINVLPAEARAWVDGRILPGQTKEGCLQALSTRRGQDITV